MMLLKRVELLQMYTCATESRAWPSARTRGAAGAGGPEPAASVLAKRLLNPDV